MLKINVDNNGNIIEAKFDFQCMEHLADVINHVLDYILSCEIVNVSPKKRNLSKEDKEDIIITEKEKLFEIMKNRNEAYYYEMSGTRYEDEF